MFILKKRMFQGNLTEAFQFIRKPVRKLERDSIKECSDRIKG